MGIPPLVYAFRLFFTILCGTAALHEMRAIFRP
jgi:hypothetical protein